MICVLLYDMNILSEFKGLLWSAVRFVLLVSTGRAAFPFLFFVANVRSPLNFDFDATNSAGGHECGFSGADLPQDYIWPPSALLRSNFSCRS